MAVDLSGAHLGRLDDGEFSHRLGLRRLNQGQWLELSHPALDEQRRQKAKLMSELGSELLVVLPEAEAAALELQSEIAEEHVLQDVPQPDFDPNLHPLDAAARTVREDLCLVSLIDGDLVLVGGSVCFPTRWTLSEKVGRNLDLIHEPVPGYAEDVADRVNTFVARLPAGAGVWRRNWSLMPTGELCLPGRHDHLPLGTEPADMWLRTERQTLRRLRRTGAVVFTIAIDVDPLPTLRGSDPARQLANAVESLPAAFANYKGLALQGSAVAAYLRS